MKNERYNPQDEVIVQLQKHNFFYAQVVKDNGNMVDILIKESTRFNEKTFLYDMEYSVSKNIIIEKIYDAKTDTNLVMSN